MRRTSLVTVRNARFQQWRSLLDNRAKRQRHKEFLVHGVRPVSLALEHSWPVTAVLRPHGTTLSRWAESVVQEAVERRGAEPFSLAPELLRELGERDDEPPELVLVAVMPPDDPTRLEPRIRDQERVGRAPLVVVFDRPASPGNLGTLVRSADAFGASGLLVTGHAADPYDPKAVRATTGSLFALPVVRLDAPRDAASWAHDHGLAIVGTDEHGTIDIADHDLSVPTMVVVGTERRGMSRAWRELCDTIARIPIGGAASSLNAAAAGTVVLYEAARQRTAAAQE